MKVKTFIAPDIRQAIRMVREEQGPDAVILSNRRVEGGIEIVSAIDYDEALYAKQQSTSPVGQSTDSPRLDHTLRGYHENKVMSHEPPVSTANTGGRPVADDAAEKMLNELRHEIKAMRSYMEHQISEISWNALKHQSPVQAEIINRLLDFGLSAQYAKRLAEKLPQADTAEKVWPYCLECLANELSVADDDIVANGGVVALVGPTGVGKTTTVAKIAARYALRHGVRRIALLTTDDYRVGAHEQLRNFGRLLDIPVRSVANAQELQAQLDDLSDKDLVLIDTAGMSPKDMRLSQQFEVINGTKSKIKSYLVLPANYQRLSLQESIASFQNFRLDGCILTKLDEACSLGPALEAVIKPGLAVVYISDGQRVPEDIHLARAIDLVNKGVLMAKKEAASTIEHECSSIGRTSLNAH